MPTPCAKTCPQTVGTPFSRAFQNAELQRIDLPSFEPQARRTAFPARCADCGTPKPRNAPDGRAVRVDPARAGRVIGDAVGTRGVDRHARRHRRPPGGIGAGVEVALERPCRKACLRALRRAACGCRTGGAWWLTAWTRCAGIGHAHRLAGLQCGQRQIGLHRDVELRAEAAAYRRRHDPDVACGPWPECRPTVSRSITGRLRAGVDFQPAVADRGIACLRLDIGMFHETGFETPLDHDIGPRQRRIRIAA